jgi:hypothetical protein
LYPIDPLDDEDARWLTACLWPGQDTRLENLRRALDAARRLANSPERLRVERASVGDVPLLLGAPQSHAIAYQTVVRDYLAADELARYQSGMLDWLRANPASTFWVELELAQDDSPPETSAAITVQVAAAPESEPESFELARCHPHPSVIQVQKDEVARFLEALG